jgi:hypothetical protein
VSRPYISAELRAQVFADAGHLCGYCHSDERISGIALSVEHIIPRAADGATVRENLWRSCRPCNEQKGALTSAPDSETGETATLSNPRTQPWRALFALALGVYWASAALHGRLAMPPDAYFHLLADAFLRGRLWPEDPPATHDLTLYGGHWFLGIGAQFYQNGTIRPSLLRWAPLSLAPIGLAGALLLAYMARFGNPWDFGYTRQNVAQELAGNLRTYGQFSLHYVPRNLGVMLLAGPKKSASGSLAVEQPGGNDALYAADRCTDWLGRSFLGANS